MTTDIQISHAQPATAQYQQLDQPKRRITAKVRAAIDAMVWQGLKRSDAAQAAGLKDNSLYVAMAKPDVRAYYLSQCEVLRTSGRARRLHRLEQIAEQDDNKQAAVNAIKALDYQEDQAQISRNTAQMAPGFVINVIHASAPATTAGTVIDQGVKPDMGLLTE